MSKISLKTIGRIGDPTPTKLREKIPPHPLKHHESGAYFFGKLNKHLLKPLWQSFLVFSDVCQGGSGQKND